MRPAIPCILLTCIPSQDESHRNCGQNPILFLKRKRVLEKYTKEEKKKAIDLYIRYWKQSTNTIESLNYTLRKVTKNRTAFPEDDYTYKIMHLTISKISRKWSVPVRNWGVIFNQLSIMFGDRVILWSQTIYTILLTPGDICLALEVTQCICLLDLLTVVGETSNATALAVTEGNSLSPFLLSINMALHLIFSSIERPDFLSPGPCDYGLLWHYNLNQVCFTWIQDSRLFLFFWS